MNNYIRFSQAFLLMYKQFLNGQDTATDMTKGGYAFTGKSSDRFYSDLKQNLEKTHVFVVDDDVKKMLLLTKAPKDNTDLKLPFPSTFIDVEFKKEELAQFGIKIDTDILFGLLVRKGVFMVENPLSELMQVARLPDDDIEGIFKAGENLRVSVGVIINPYQDTKKDWVGIDTVNILNVLNYDANVLQINSEVTERDKKVISDFIVNFINFLYNPEVEQVKVERSEKNVQRRIKNGKMPLPSSYSIKLTGHLRDYVDSIKAGRHFHYSFQFWVKGFYRILKSDRYKEKKGLRLWIPPFKKGQGILIKKFYSIEKEDGDNN